MNESIVPLTSLTAFPWKAGDAVSIDHIRYQVESCLAGGMGDVYITRRLQTLRGIDRIHLLRLAVKTIRAELSAKESRQAFRRELNYWILLEHPNILQLLLIAGNDDHLAAITPVCDGSLRDILRERHILALAELHLIIDQLVGALRYAQALHGLVHLDLKPENILYLKAASPKDLRIMLGDWGIANIQRIAIDQILQRNRATERLAQTYNNWGTLPYMAPERFFGGFSTSVLSDIYALGMISLEALVGRLPYDSSQGSMVEQISEAKYYRTAAQIVAGIEPTRVRDFVMKAIHPNPRERFNSYEVLGNELARLRSPVSRIWRTLTR